MASDVAEPKPESMLDYIGDLILFTGDVHLTSIAMAMATSVCVSVICLIWGLLHHYKPSEPAISTQRSPSVKRDVALVKRKKSDSNSIMWNSWYSNNIQRGSWDTVHRVVEEACKMKPVEIDLSYMHLTCCPRRIGFVGPQLYSLNLSNNRLCEIPEEVGCLRGLEELFLQYNCLTELPKSIGNLINLTELDLKNNMLMFLPDTIGHLRKLSILNVTNNALEHLPGSLGNLIELKEFSAHSNQLRQLPCKICNLINLTTLYLGENPLQSLPSEISCLIHLQELDVSDCELTVLPDSLSYCTALVRLWLSNNMLTRLPALMGRLHKLKELHVRNNCLQHFPASLKYLHLYTFTAMQNPLIEEGEEEKIQALCQQPPCSVMSLKEISARAVIIENITWSNEQLPRQLQVMLQQKRLCSSCLGPFFDYFQSGVVFGNVGSFFRVPLYQQICSPGHQSICHRVRIM